MTYNFLVKLEDISHGRPCAASVREVIVTGKIHNNSSVQVNVTIVPRSVFLTTAKHTAALCICTMQNKFSDCFCMCQIIHVRLLLLNYRKIHAPIAGE